MTTPDTTADRVEHLRRALAETERRRDTAYNAIRALHTRNLRGRCTECGFWAPCATVRIIDASRQP